MTEKLLAVIRIRGRTGVNPKASKTLELLKLRRKHSCNVIPANKVSLGMLQSAKDFVTWGEINKDVLAKLKKSGKEVFKLKPPKGGFKSIKRDFKSGGDLGYRGDDINKLIMRML
jgi:large subunit ribosomal protein L30